MEKLFNIHIYTPEKTIFEGKASVLSIPAGLGNLTVLANHAPLISTINPGKISYKNNSGDLIEINSESKGLVEVFENNAVLLLDF